MRLQECPDVEIMVEQSWRILKISVSELYLNASMLFSEAGLFKTEILFTVPDGKICVLLETVVCTPAAMVIDSS